MGVFWFFVANVLNGHISANRQKIKILSTLSFLKNFKLEEAMYLYFFHFLPLGWDMAVFWWEFVQQCNQVEQCSLHINIYYLYAKLLCVIDISSQMPKYTRLFAAVQNRSSLRACFKVGAINTMDYHQYLYSSAQRPLTDKFQYVLESSMQELSGDIYCFLSIFYCSRE